MQTQKVNDISKNVVIIGCGYIAHHYIKTIKSNYPYLHLLGICDKNDERVKRHADFFSVNIFPDLDSVINDDRIDIVVNLTEPENHFLITKQCLEAQINVYSEKPIAMSLSEVIDLFQIAQNNNVQLSGAPCTILSETAQTIWRSLKTKSIGDVKLIYAEIDDGPLHVLTPMIKNKLGIAWPHKNEFKTGCTLEHAAYHLSWFTAFFGPVKKVTAFSKVLLPEKNIAGEPIAVSAPDFSCACIEFRSGEVLRLTNSILAPQNHEVKIVGDKGVISTNECWDYYAPCFIQKYIDKDANPYLKAFSKRIKFLSWVLGLTPKKIKLVRYPSLKNRLLKNPLRIYNHDFARGVAEMALSLIFERRNFLAPDYIIHIHEIIFAIQNAMHTESVYEMTTSFEPFSAEHLIWDMPRNHGRL